MHGPAAEALLEGAEYCAETEDVAGSLDVAAAAEMQPPRPVDWGAMTKAQRETWRKNAQKMAKGKRPRFT